MTEESTAGTFLDTSREVYKNERGRVGFDLFLFYNFYLFI